MESDIDLWDRSAIILVKQKKDIERVLKDFMLQFGNFIAAKQFRKAMLFTTKTTIILITVWKIWNVFHLANILKNMRKTDYAGIIAKKVKNTSNWFKKKLKNGIKALRVKNGIGLMLKPVLTNYIPTYARYAALNLKELETPFTVQENATILNMQDEPGKKELNQEVYNLTVEEYGVYFANDVLVSNCDTAADAIKIALIDKTIISSQVNAVDYTKVAKTITGQQNKVNRLRQSAYRQ
jgi:hypothetical protein